VRVLLLAPSAGLGGGIERFAHTVQTVLAGAGVACERLNLTDPGTPLTLLRRIRFALAVRHIVHNGQLERDRVRLILMHRNLLPVLALLRRRRGAAPVTVILHGAEAWHGGRVRGRYWLRRPYVRAVTASSYTAGALARVCRAGVLAPGLSPAWFDTLTRAAMLPREPHDGLRLLTAFRLSAWRDKGLDTILDAVRIVGRDDVSLTICGSGPVPPDLVRRLVGVPRCRLVVDAADDELAELYAAADAFVLATRTRGHDAACGEGFGLVLLEAQLAGATVIAPAFGGSADAFQPDLTGVSPVDESPEALAPEIIRLLDDPKRRRELRDAAAAWARARFDPELYRRQLIRTLLP
jgi:glycosyltransferase involved in cell wall biosynthesis